LKTRPLGGIRAIGKGKETATMNCRVGTVTGETDEYERDRKKGKKGGQMRIM